MTGRVPDNGREVKVTTTDVDTRLETVVRKGRRGLGGWWWPALLLVPLLLAGLMAMFTSGTVAKDLAIRSGEALAKTGVPGGSISFSGRDGTLTLPAGADKDAALKAVQGVNGVRVVNVVTGGVAAPSASASVVMTTPVPSASPSAAPSVAAGPGFTVATAADGKSIQLKGEVADDAAKAALEAAVKAANPGVTIDNQLTVKAGAPALPAAAFGALASQLKAIPGVTITGADNKITLTGEVASEAVKTALGTAAKALNPTATVDNQLTVKASTVSADCAAVNTKVAAELKAKPVQFAVSSANILPASVTMLNDVAKQLKGCLGASGGATGVSVGGHTDSDGSDALNLTLSQNRADAVKAQLVSAGLPADKITAKGFGESNPIADNNTAAGKAQNRRVEIQLT